LKKKVQSRFILMGVLAIIAAAAFFLPYTSAFESMPDWWKKNIGITMGLDLQGGLHIVYEVDGDGAVAIITNTTAAVLKEAAAEEDIEIDVETEGFLIKVSPQSPEVSDFISKEYPALELTTGGAYRIKEAVAQYIKDNAPDQVIERIRNRIDKLGVREPTIVRQGADQVLIQLPGIKDPSRAIEMIGRPGVLEFKMAHDEHPVASELPQRIAPDAEEEVLEQFKDKIPEDDEIRFIVIKDPTTNEVVSKIPILLKSKVELTGDLLTEARMTIDQRFNEPYVSLRFNPTGAKIFEKVTTANVNKRMAILLDGTGHSAPNINEPIAGGDAMISGRFTIEEATDLALVLRQALPAPTNMLQNVTVGPSLGRDSIDAGKKAGLIGLLLVVVFMIIYYRMAGVIANFALGLNILLLLGGMALVGATLTLPGIAGVILAIGMAVDSNVLMFERMREEIRTGKTPRAAVDSGYDKAFWTIFDSHVTTLITALVLFQFGTGPIKGFAVTLSFGVAINLFTALVGTKTVFDYINSRTEVKRLSI
jgi:preprotein translocase subunit SecD